MMDNVKMIMIAVVEMFLVFIIKSFVIIELYV